MFNKFEFFGAAVVSLIVGIAIGYNKAKEKILEALIKSLPTKNENSEEEEEKESQ